VVLFLIALLCKTSVVMFPAVLLLYAWWRRGRVERRDGLAVLPFFGPALVFGVATIWFQQHHAIFGADLEIGGLISRLAGAGVASAFYAQKILIPVGLAPIYPRWHFAPPGALQFLPWAAWGGIAAWLVARRSLRGAVFGLICYLLLLFPVTGFIPMAYLRISWVADHLAYVPMLGLIGAAAGGLRWALSKPARPAWRAIGPDAGRRRPVALYLLVVLAIAFLAVASHRQAAIYRDDETFWREAIQRNPQAWLARNDLGLVLATSGRWPEAIEQYRRGIGLKPDFAELHNNLGTALAGIGRFDDAESEYREALRLAPDYLFARINLGSALAQSGRPEEAIAAYELALRLRPDDAEIRGDLAFAQYRLANDLGNSGRLADAIVHYQEAVRLKPDYAEARANLGLALAGSNRRSEAVAQLQAALRLRPDYPEAHAYLGFALAGAGRFLEAIEEYRAALRHGPGSADLHYNFAAALRAAGRSEEAAAEFEKAARLESGAEGGRN
jgi:tetratricopeptide (TPR) repeat protein